MKIVLWGGPGAGKTVYLSCLYFAVNRASRSEWEIRVNNEQTDKFIQQANKTMRVDKKFPAPTDPKEAPKHYSFQITHRQRRWLFPKEIKADLELFDTAGEFFAAPEKTEASKDIYQQILDAQGMICLIDRGNKDVFSLILKNFNKIRMLFAEKNNVGNIPMPVAICFSKMDNYAKEFHKDIKKFALDTIGIDGVREIQRNAHIHRFFPVSSIGDLGNGLSNHYLDESGKQRLIQEPNPHNLLEPIKWLIKNRPRRRI